MKKRLLCFLLAFMVLTLSSATPSAADAQTANTQEILVVAGKYLPIRNFNGQNYVSLYGLCLAIEKSSADYSGGNAFSIQVTKGELSASAVEGEKLVTANGRYLFSAHENIFCDKVLYVPMDSAVKAVGGRIEQIENGYYYLETNASAAIAPAEDYYDADCVLWLGRIIEAESGNQPLEGKIAVGSVVMNRVDSPDYPDTIYSVIFDNQYGVQFTPAATGAVWCDPGEESILAAKIVLDGYRTDHDILYFMNEAIATSTWISENCDYAFTIADHSFWS